MTLTLKQVAMINRDMDLRKKLMQMIIAQTKWDTTLAKMGVPVQTRIKSYNRPKS